MNKKGVNSSKVLITIFISILLGQNSIAQNRAIESKWPSDRQWWKANNLRLIQTNLPAYEAKLNVDSLIADLRYFSANVLLINAGGIMAFYPTELDFHYINPHMQKNMLRDVIEKCHYNGIKVIVRFDFSRLHESIFKKHPDWCYISPSNKRMINDDMYVASVNAPYVQKKSIQIVEEVIENYPIDGLFINMPGYLTTNYYIDEYLGIDQNEHDKKRFAAYSNGLEIPKEENWQDPVFQKYSEFKSYTVDQWLQNMQQMVKSKSDQIAICTYSDKYVDIIRHESQTRHLPYWPYNSTDNVKNVTNSHPDKILSNASIQQISFRSRYNAIEPEEIAIRLYENIANGSGLDISLMGDFRNYEDERNFEALKTIYAHHKKFEKYYGKYLSVAKIAIISPGYWPGGEEMLEYRGIQLMLNEAHLQYDIIQADKIPDLADKLKQYKLLILPEIVRPTQESVKLLSKIVKNGTNIIATNRSFSENPILLNKLFGAKIKKLENNGYGNYLKPKDKSLFTRFEKQSMLFFKFNLALTDFQLADETYLPILSKGRPGPPEKIGGHDPTGFYAMGVKNHNQSKAVLLPINLGKLYYIHGYEQHKNILLDVIDYVYPGAGKQLITNAHPRIETILNKFTFNTPENINKTQTDGLILHLINLTGFSGNTYFDPLPIYDLNFNIKSEFTPKKVYDLETQKPINFLWEKNYITFKADNLKQYKSIVIEK